LCNLSSGSIISNSEYFDLPIIFRNLFKETIDTNPITYNKIYKQRAAEILEKKKQQYQYKKENGLFTEKFEAMKIQRAINRIKKYDDAAIKLIVAEVTKKE
jgi:hypothetical protein